MARLRYGDWSKLTVHLSRDGKKTISLSDDEMQVITGSIDETRPYNIDFADANYCIRRRAGDAGYNVVYSPGDKSTKLFTKCQ